MCCNKIRNFYALFNRVHWAHHHWKHRFEEKLAAMTPEEREKFKEEYYHNCCWKDSDKESDRVCSSNCVNSLFFIVIRHLFVVYSHSFSVNPHSIAIRSLPRRRSESFDKSQYKYFVNGQSRYYATIHKKTSMEQYPWRSLSSLSR
jgi:hypothetical protein